MQLYNTLSAKERAALIEEAGKERLTISFYKYAHIGNPNLFRNHLFIHWNDLDVLGRIYVAHEGINAQLSVPAENFEAFKKQLDSISFLENVRLNIAIEQDNLSFLKLKVKVRHKIVVIDSVAALTPKSEIEGEMGDSKMGLHARLMSQALRKLTGSISKTNCTVIFINQLREKIGVMFGNPETTTGGNALKFYASVRLDIRRSTQIKDTEGNVQGNKTRVKVVKNKVAPPFRTTEFDIMYGVGISKVGEIIDLGVEYEIIKKSGSWFSYGDTKLGQGRDAVKALLLDNPELFEELDAKIREAINALNK